MGKKPSKQVILRMIALIVVTMTVFAVYRFFVSHRLFPVVLTVYMALTTGLILGYVIYNRGMSRRGVTAEMLPADWSEEKKQTFIQSGKERMNRSRWMLIPIFAFLFTFALDALELFVLPVFTNLFKT